jgi:hypothetical protein
MEDPSRRFGDSEIPPRGRCARASLTPSLDAMSPTKPPEQESPMRPDPDQAAGPPGWASVLGIAAVVLVLGLIVVLHLSGVLGGGGH